MPATMKIKSEVREDHISEDDMMEFEDGRAEIKQPELKVPAKLKMKTQISLPEDSRSSVGSSANQQGSST